MITTFTGKTVNPLNLQKEDISIADIAHSLALINRFNGHSKFPISVAQHCVYVSRLCTGTGWELQGLLHDAGEAYFGDMTKWLKMKMVEYRLAEAEVQGMIYDIWGGWPEANAVQRADELMVRFEARKAFGEDFDFGGNHTKYPPITKEEKYSIGHWHPWKWTTAEEIFLSEFYTLVDLEVCCETIKQTGHLHNLNCKEYGCGADI